MLWPGSCRAMGESPVRLGVIAGLAVVALIVGGLLGRATPLSPPVGQVAGSADANEGVEDPSPADTIRVHVSGMVVAPGVVDLAPGAIVADAVDAAGGLQAGAVVDQINLAAPVSDGDQVVVPGAGGDSMPAQGQGDGILSLSRATAAELETLPGVGPVLAERIVSFREQNGGFDTVEDLLEVPGIGEAKLGAIRDLVRP